MTKWEKPILTAMALLTFSGELACGETYPNIDDQLTPFSDFANAKEGVGSDGNERFIWDYFEGKAYKGSALWILNPQGQLIGAGNATIPSAGTGLVSATTSNLAIHVYAGTNNSQVAFAFYDPTKKQVTSFATWTFNAQGQLIGAAGPFGPFSDTQIENLSFHTGALVVKWLFGNGANAVWALDQYGKTISVAGPFGPYPGVKLGIVTIDSPAPNQLWHWLITTPEPQYGLNTWTISPAGAIIATSSFGPW